MTTLGVAADDLRIVVALLLFVLVVVLVAMEIERHGKR